MLLLIEQLPLESLDPLEPLGLSENRLNPIVPNGFADHYPYKKWLFHWEY